jgi:exonuclease V gamma subunit
VPKPKVEHDALIEAYVRHVILGATRGEDGSPPWATCVVAAEKALKVLDDTVGDPGALLDEMIAGFVEGQRRPLRFFRGTTLAWCSKSRQLDERFDVDVARSVADEIASAWEGGDHQRGDRDEDEVALCMRGVRTADLIDDDFLRWARLFDPVVAATSGRRSAKWPPKPRTKGGAS